MTTLASDLRRWHRDVARVTGAMSLTIERRAARRSDLAAWAATLKGVAKELNRGSAEITHVKRADDA